MVLTLIAGTTRNCFITENRNHIFIWTKLNVYMYCWKTSLIIGSVSFMMEKCVCERAYVCVCVCSVTCVSIGLIIAARCWSFGWNWIFSLSVMLVVYGIVCCTDCEAWATEGWLDIPSCALQTHRKWHPLLS